MIFRPLIKIFLTLCFIAIYVYSCEEFCEELDRTAIVVNFFDYSKLEETGEDVALNVNIDVRAIGRDSIYSQTRQQIMLPINPTMDNMAFVLKRDTLPADTLIFNYIRRTVLVSPKCGFVNYALLHESDGVVRPSENTIKRIVISNYTAGTVTYREGILNAENIKIYY